jgi:hypothetical protein
MMNSVGRGRRRFGMHRDRLIAVGFDPAGRALPGVERPPGTHWPIPRCGVPSVFQIIFGDMGEWINLKHVHRPGQSRGTQPAALTKQPLGAGRTPDSPRAADFETRFALGFL